MMVFVMVVVVRCGQALPVLYLCTMQRVRGHTEVAARRFALRQHLTYMPPPSRSLFYSDSNFQTLFTHVTNINAHGLIVFFSAEGAKF